MTHLQKEEDLRLLFEQWLKGPLDKDIVERLVKYADDETVAELWQELLEQQNDSNRNDRNLAQHAQVIEKVYQSLVLSNPELKVKTATIRMFSLQRYAAAAVLLVIVLSAILYTVSLRKNEEPTVAQTTIQNDLSPGRNGAVLTLSDGRKVSLDSVANGVIATEKGAAVSLEGERVVYDADQSAIKQVTYNTMSTARGRRFQLTLSDGTKVWLNAASSITYPTNFVGPNRTVSIEGEVYFEVAANKSRPFIVKYPISKTGSGGQVEVLGTKFNINSYPEDGPVKATLVEGSIKVRKLQLAQILAPGQQAQVDGSNYIKLIKEADISMETAWLNGEFNFKYADLKTVMRQLARWYDLEVAYEEGAPLTKRFGGEIPMDAMISQVLTVLGKSGVHFKLEGRKLTILP